MTVIYLSELNCECYGVTFESNGCVKAQNFEDILSNEKNVLCVRPIKTLLGESQICDMTEMPGANDKEIFDGNTILLKISEENNGHRYVYIGGDLLCSFLTDDFVYEYTSNMGNNLIPYSIAISMENIYFLTPHFNFIKNIRIDNDKLLNSSENSVDPYDYHLSQCGKDSF